MPHLNVIYVIKNLNNHIYCWIILINIQRKDHINVNIYLICKNVNRLLDIIQVLNNIIRKSIINLNNKSMVSTYHVKIAYKILVAKNNYFII